MLLAKLVAIQAIAAFAIGYLLDRALSVVLRRRVATPLSNDDFGIGMRRKAYPFRTL